MRALLALLIALAVGPVTESQARPRPVPSLSAITWQTVWADEFNGAAGMPADPMNWKTEVIDLGDTEQQSYVDDRRTSAHDGAGNMVLTAIKETSGTGRPYISGRLSNGFSNAPRFGSYGRWSARMRIPAADGVWPAFWALGDWAHWEATSPPGWPMCGEIDVMESINDAEVTHGGIHTIATGSQAHRNYGSHTAQHPSGSYANAWHVWSIYWTPAYIVWYVDGLPWQTVTRTEVQNAGGNWLFDGDRPQAPILNLAVGGMAGPATFLTPQRFLIDYVRIQVPRSLP